MIITRVEQTARFYDLRPGQLFQFPGNRTTFIMVDPHTGLYRARSGSRDTLKIAHESWIDLGKIEVVEAYATRRKPTERSVLAYEALVEQAQKSGWPRHYRDDLFFHDRILLYENDPAVFGWAVRETGTELLIPNHTHSIFLYTYYQRPEYNLERPRHRFYFWNGRSLQSATLETIEKGILNASTPRAREFARQAWFTKNNSRESAAWQKEIDAELARPGQLLVSQDRQTS